MADGITIDETIGTITLSMTGATITSVNEEAAISLDGDAAEIVVSESSVQIISETSIVATVVRDEVARVVTIAEQGPPGVAGNSDGQTAIYVYGETISALVPVVIIGGEAFRADATNSNHRGRVCGITETAATAGDSGTVRFLGPMTDASWNWSTPVVFVGPTGTLVGVPPSGFSQPIARVETPTTLFVNPLSLIERS